MIWVASPAQSSLTWPRRYHVLCARAELKLLPTSQRMAGQLLLQPAGICTITGQLSLLVSAWPTMTVIVDWLLMGGWDRRLYSLPIRTLLQVSSLSCRLVFRARWVSCCSSEWSLMVGLSTQVLPNTEAILLKACPTSAEPYPIIRQGVLVQIPQDYMNLDTLPRKSRTVALPCGASRQPAMTQQNRQATLSLTPSICTSLSHPSSLMPSSLSYHASSSLFSLLNSLSEFGSSVTKDSRFPSWWVTCSALYNSFFSLRVSSEDLKISPLVNGTMCSLSYCSTQMSFTGMNSRYLSISAYFIRLVGRPHPNSRRGSRSRLNPPASLSSSHLRMYYKACSRHSGGPASQQ